VLHLQHLFCIFFLTLGKIYQVIILTKTIIKDFALITLGGVTYMAIELIWRQRTHWTMALTGGVCFLIIYKIYTRFPYMSLPLKCIIGSLVISALELIVGCIVNIRLGWGVWDYSNMPFNLLGRVCLMFSVLWGLFCIPISGLCRLINGLSNKKINLSV